MPNQTMGRTWIEPEERAYPAGGFTRRGFVRVRANSYAPSFPVSQVGRYRKIRLSIPDTFFTIPARLKVNGRTVKGFVSVDTDAGEFTFTPEADERS